MSALDRVIKIAEHQKVSLNTKEKLVTTILKHKWLIDDAKTELAQLRSEVETRKKELWIIYDRLNAKEADNLRLQKAVDEARECIGKNTEWLENVDISYANGNVCQGIDEGEHYGGIGHCQIVKDNKDWLAANPKENSNE